MITKRNWANPRLTPRVGLEPTTTRLTAECSTIELSRNIPPPAPSKPNTESSKPPSAFLLFSWLSSRPISRRQLCMLPCLHPAPIYPVLSRGTCGFPWTPHLEGGFTLRCLQRLSLPGLATLPWSWSPTGAPAARPSRSSRTKDGSPQVSRACAG